MALFLPMEYLMQCKNNGEHGPKLVTFPGTERLAAQY